MQREAGKIPVYFKHRPSHERDEKTKRKRIIRQKENGVYLQMTKRVERKEGVSVKDGERRRGWRKGEREGGRG